MFQFCFCDTIPSTSQSLVGNLSRRPHSLLWTWRGVGPREVRWMREDKDTHAQALRPLRLAPNTHTRTHTLSSLWDSVECALYLSLLITDLSCRNVDLFMSFMQTRMSGGKWSWLGCGTAGYCVCVCVCMCMACHAVPCSLYLTYRLYIILLLHLFSLSLSLTFFISQPKSNTAVWINHIEFLSVIIFVILNTGKL